MKTNILIIALLLISITTFGQVYQSKAIENIGKTEEGQYYDMEYSKKGGDTIIYTVDIKHKTMNVKVLDGIASMVYLYDSQKSEVSPKIKQVQNYSSSFGSIHGLSKDKSDKKSIVYNFLWDYQNSYDNNIGTVHVSFLVPKKKHEPYIFIIKSISGSFYEGYIKTMP